MAKLLPRCAFTFLVILLSVGPLLAQPYRVDTLARAPFSQYPVSIAFLPGTDGRFLFTEKNSGKIRLYDRSIRPEPFASFAVDEDGEQGLLGIAVDPHYPEEPYVYVVYTRTIDRSNLLVRIRDSSAVGIDPTTLLIVPRQDDGASNNGGSLHFGPDGKLYVGLGDYGIASNAQDIQSKRNYRGKILRLNRDGSIPADSPIPGRPFWSHGHRNPLGFTFDEETGLLYCVESGTSARNEVYLVPRGANLGWTSSGRDGKPERLTGLRPLYSFSGSSQPALTSIVMYRAQGFPRMRGKLLFGGHANPTIWSGTIIAGGDSLLIEPFFRSNAGYADIQIAPDGSIVFTNGPYISSRILRLMPVAPGYLSTPPLLATEGMEYWYTPSFSGTPPSLALLEGPEGMTIDSATWSLHWMPTRRQAVTNRHSVTLRAENGAGFAEQRFSVQVININDPPLPFRLIEPTDERTYSFLGSDPEVIFRWTPSEDPDADTVQYTVQIDTVGTFTSHFRRDSLVTDLDSLRVMLPRRSGEYFWRVLASDGKLTTPSTPAVQKLMIMILPPSLTRSDRERLKETMLDQNFPNPFNPATSITYVIPRAGLVRLSVYNLLGQEVATLFEGVQQPGTYDIEFTKANLPSGIYFYRIQAPGLFETKKMVIAK